MRIQFICTQDIKKPFHFCYHYELENHDLQKSVMSQGIINPIWVIQKNGYQIIDGHRRWQAAKIAKISRIPVSIFSEKDLFKTFLSALHLNLINGKLSTIEQCKVIHLTRRFFTPDTYQQISEILEISRIPDVNEVTTRAMLLPLWIQRYFHQMDFSLKVINRIIHYSLTSYLPWLKMAAALKLNGFELMQLMENVQDISLQNKIKVNETFQLLKIEKILQREMTVQQKIRHLKTVIAEKRWPLLHRSNAHIQAVINSFPDFFREIAQISWDKTLEQSVITISLPAKSVEDVKQAIMILSKIEIQNKLQELFDQFKKLR